jgi:hypothetical protein
MPFSFYFVISFQLVDSILSMTTSLCEPDQISMTTVNDNRLATLKVDENKSHQSYNFHFCERAVLC